MTFLNPFKIDASDLYSVVESTRSNLLPTRSVAIFLSQLLQLTNYYPSHFSNTFYGTSVLNSSLDMFERFTRTYKKLQFGITKCIVDEVEQRIVKKTL